ncbi:MAG: hypothetical protein IT292_00875 [Deltaproteobacteria bacterium]|nr:hypothetical protein [Deltaproteobacteria bacterium]
MEVSQDLGSNNWQTILSNRKKLTMVPYAMYAYTTGTNAVVSTSIKDGTVNTADLADRAVTDAKIAGGLNISKLDADV